MKKIFVVYRENDLYDKLVPKIIEWLNNHEVEIVTFPSSANKDEIKIGINTQLKMFRNNIVISDKTCQSIIDEEDEIVNPSKYTSNFQRIRKENPILFTDTLDLLCDKAIKITYGGVFEEECTAIKNEDADGVKITSNLLEKIKSHGMTPKKIHIVTECTGDHSPFCYWNNGINDDPDSRRKYEIDIVAPAIAQLFVKKFGNIIEIVSALKNKEVSLDILSKINAPETWIIMDRHFTATMKYSGLDWKNFFNQATVLRLPIFDFFEDVYRNKILKIADEIFASEECLKKLISEEIKKY
ncbi:MAG TPA: hypothetical protein DEA43_02765 [Candidatus Moranbacteria bacterium]|nr:hypothetical protein [Candidatus Moranbacteria bacterium]HBT45779.1 hypothetical protein [Candidatus Moranbacteria bacterium]